MQPNKYLAVLTAALVLLALVTVGAMAGLGTVGADSHEDPSNDRSISVSAVGEADAEPDKAVLEVAVTVEGDEPDEIRDELASDAERVTDVLDEMDVEYETSHFAIDRPRIPPEVREEEDIPEYRGIHAFTVDVADPDDVGAVIDAAADAGAEVNDVKLTLSEEKRLELRDDAINAAMSDGRHQANTIADAGDLEVTSVATVDASQRRFSPVRFDAAVEREAGGDGAAPPTTIATGDVSVTYQVQVTFNSSTSNGS